MLYDLNKMDSLTFERISQSLFLKICGPTCHIYGIGRDGKREAVWEHDSPVEIGGHTVTGRTFMQSKHKNVLTKESDFAWLKKQIKTEMTGLDKIKINEPKYLPANYFLFTNVRLSSVKDSGEKDKIAQYAKTFSHVVPNIYIVSYDEICAVIDSNSDVRNAYFSFLTSGDVISKLYKSIIDNEEKEQKALHKAILRFMDYEFNEDLYSRLKEAGDVTGNQIPLERVFMDLEASCTRADKNESVNIIKHMVSIGNRPLHERTPFGGTSQEERRIVLLGDAGQGKSTLGQYLIQIYRAVLLKADASAVAPAGVDSFLAAYNADFSDDITCMRMPFRIVLKDYAAWIKENGGINTSCSVLFYLAHRITIKTGQPVLAAKLYEFLENRSWLFIFDGLDEVPSTSNRSDVMKQIYSFTETDLRRQNIDAFIVATSRQQDYHDDFPALAYNHYRLIDMKPEICLKYAAKLINQIEPNYDEREKYIAILNEGLKDPTVSKLMQRPLHASIVAILVRNGGRPPREKYALFHEYISVNIKRERQKNIFNGLINYEEIIIRIHEEVAFALQQSSSHAENAAAVLQAHELEAIVTKKILALGHDPEAAAKIGKELLGVISRLAFLSGSDTTPYVYTIRSVQEYFAAEYLISDKEYDDITSELVKLAPNAYWRNVFVFAVSHFVKKRQKLTDYVDLICAKLNGSELPPLEYDVFKGSFMGARLALDLLHENIFSEKINMENAFLNHLEKILKLHFIGSDFEKIANLPVRILQKFIANYLHPYMNQHPNSKTAWQIVGVILKKNKNIVIDIAKDILTNHDVDIDMVLSVVESDEINAWLLPFVVAWLANGNIITGDDWRLINVADFDVVILGHEKRNVYKAALLKSALLEFEAYKFYTDASDWFLINFRIEISDIIKFINYETHYSVISLNLIDKKLELNEIKMLNRFNTICEEAGLKFFEKWSAYRLNESKQNLIELVQLYYNENKYVRSKLRDFFDYTISLRIILFDCLLAGLNNEEAIRYLNENFEKQRKLLDNPLEKVFADVSGFKDLKKSDFWKYHNYSATSSKSSIKQFINDFNVTANEVPDYNIYFIYKFLFVAVVSLNRIEDEVIMSLNNDKNSKDVLKASFKYIQSQTILTNDLISTHRQAFSIQFLLLLANGEFPNYNYHEFETVDIKRIGRVYRFTNVSVCSRLFKKINNFINLTEAEHNALKIIPTLVYQTEIDKSDIGINVLTAFSCDNPYNEFGRLILCLLGGADEISARFDALCTQLEPKFIATITACAVMNSKTYTPIAMNVITDLYVKIKVLPMTNQSVECLSTLEQAMFEIASNSLH